MVTHSWSRGTLALSGGRHMLALVIFWIVGFASVYIAERALGLRREEFARE